jgi:hypothetical protein
MALMIGLWRACRSVAIMPKNARGACRTKTASEILALQNNGKTVAKKGARLKHMAAVT